MKQIRVGTFLLGNENVDLYALPDETGGEFYFCPDAISTPRIKVGLNQKEWEQCVNVLLHESFEFAMARHRARFVRCGKYNDDHADYLFVFDHPEFASACSDVASFITPALPLLAAIYGKRRRSRKG